MEIRDSRDPVLVAFDSRSQILYTRVAMVLA